MRYLNEIRDYAQEFYKCQSLHYLKQKYWVYSAAGLSKYIPSKLQIPILDSFVGLPIRNLLYSNFCGGTNLDAAQSVADKYRLHNVHGILDFAAESLDTSGGIFNISTILPQSWDGDRTTIFSLKLTSIFGFERLKALNALCGSGVYSDLDSIIEILRKADCMDKFVTIDRFLQSVMGKYKITIDAESSDIQSAISTICLLLMQKYNRGQVMIYNTYQGYLRNSFDAMTSDIGMANKRNFTFAAKIVRGAYMKYESQIGSNAVFSNIESTHRNYDKMIEYLLKNASNDAEIIVATHNDDSIAKCLDLQDKNKRKVSFAQLHGMRDYLTYYLAENGHQVFKYIPYGPEKLTTSYLIRRSQENSSMVTAMQEESKLIIQTLSGKI